MTELTLPDLGWSDHFARQVTNAAPYRITEVHRDTVTALSPAGEHRLMAPMGTGAIAVGDWVTADAESIAKVLNRQSVLERRTAGTDVKLQLIAANVTTLAIVTSCNADFNEARLERYLVLAAEAGCLPLIVLTKADQSEDADDYRRKAERLSPMVTALTINAKDQSDVDRLAPWVKPGDTLALVGSSGVGKTTLRNALTGQKEATQDIREDDARGRHTTTARAMVRTKLGGWLIDTPGMRALRLSGASDGISAVFDDLEELAASCRFNDCAHDTEPGCAIQAAIAIGSLDPARLKRWRKLVNEEERNSESVAQARARDKGFGKMVKGAMAQKRGRKDF
ncbi:MAG: ribosome small subunit-dependent GTPase A [Silicimonas sp.]|nr:ribosome small subunit-dependent GTPase A [Silicimonas sp.]